MEAMTICEIDARIVELNAALSAATEPEVQGWRNAIEFHRLAKE